MKPKRIQRKRTKGWRMPDNTIYVGRPSKYGNHFIEGTDGGASYCFAAHSVWVEGVFNHQHTNETCKKEADLIRKLKGKNLSCWCPLDKPCHADTLLEFANR